MDALMIVHQLQRLAAEPRPSAAVRAKIPRMAVGICYFLEHPDTGVQHQAAGALRLLLQHHRDLLLQSAELQELRVALQQHTKSSDVVVRECCSASLALMQEQEHQEEQKKEPAEHQGRAQQQRDTETDVETLESLDMFSVVLGLRGLLRCPSNLSLLTFERQQETQQQNQQEQQGRRMLEMLQRDLQLRLVRVWGVSSATVTLNTESLLQQAAALNGAASAATLGERQQSEEGDGVAVVSIRLSRRAHRLQQQLRELRAAVGPLTLLLSSQLVQQAPQRSAGRTPESPSCDTRPAIGASASSAPTEDSEPQKQNQPHEQQQRESGYLDEELRGNWGGAGESSGGAQSGSNGNFSFFSANSALFGEI